MPLTAICSVCAEPTPVGVETAKKGDQIGPLVGLVFVALSRGSMRSLKPGVCTTCARDIAASFARAQKGAVSR